MQDAIFLPPPPSLLWALAPPLPPPPEGGGGARGGIKQCLCDQTHLQSPERSPKMHSKVLY